MKKTLVLVLGSILAMTLSACSDSSFSPPPGNIPTPTPTPTPQIFPVSCLEIFNAGETADGVYEIDPDGDGGVDAFPAQCDMTTDGGGWTLVLNYLHQSMTTPPWEIRTHDLPVIGSSTLGTNENATAYWGHAGNQLLSRFTFTESRWYCITSAHARVLHFKSSSAACNSYISSGAGECMDIGTNFTPLTGHTANLPASVDNTGANNGDLAMIFFPFNHGAIEFWGLATGGNRWDCDDLAFGGISDTLHRIWVR